MYNLVFSKKSLKFLDKHRGEPIVTNIFSVLEILKNNPNDKRLDSKKMKGNTDQHRLRVGKYRVLYVIRDEVITIFVVDIDSRGNIYK